MYILMLPSLERHSLMSNCCLGVLVFNAALMDIVHTGIKIYQ